MCVINALLPLSSDTLRSDSDGGSETTVAGGEFTGCRSSKNGAFLHASDGAIVTITGGTVKDCEATRRAGAVSDPSAYLM